MPHKEVIFWFRSQYCWNPSWTNLWNRLDSFDSFPIKYEISNFIMLDCTLYNKSFIILNTQCKYSLIEFETYSWSIYKVCHYKAQSQWHVFGFWRPMFVYEGQLLDDIMGCFETRAWPNYTIPITNITFYDLYYLFYIFITYYYFWTAFWTDDIKYSENCYLGLIIKTHSWFVVHRGNEFQQRWICDWTYLSI